MSASSRRSQYKKSGLVKSPAVREIEKSAANKLLDEFHYLGGVRTASRWLGHGEGVTVWGVLPDDDKGLARICRLGLGRWKKIKPVITELFEREVWGDTTADRVLGAGQAASSRPAIPLSVRQLVFERDGNKCRYCDREEEPFEIDHIVPWSRGGEHVLENLVVSCLPCNRSKGARTPEEWRQ